MKNTDTVAKNNALLSVVFVLLGWVQERFLSQGIYKTESAKSRTCLVTFFFYFFGFFILLL